MNLKKVLKENLTLIAFTFISILYLLFLYFVREKKLFSYLLTVLYVCLYIFYGIYHHYKKKDLTLKILLEYVLIGSIVLFILKILIVG